MTQPDDSRPRRAAHRGRRNPSTVILPILFAIAVVAVAVVVVTRVLSRIDSPDPSAVSTGTTSAASTPTTPSATPSASPTPTGSPRPSHSAAHSATSSPSPSTSRPRPTPSAAPKVAVTVFNQTSMTGAAAALAGQLQAAGWPVAGVGNWVGYVPSTTVYYWPGAEASAQRLAEEFPQVGRVRPASSPMPAGTLVVIIAD